MSANTVMTQPCPAPHVLGAYLEGSQASRPDVEVHLARCPRCRERIVLASRVLAPRRSLPWIGWAAAAALLLTVAGWHALASRTTALESQPRPGLVPLPAVPAVEAKVWETQATPAWWSLPGGSRLALAPGSRLFLSRDPGELTLERGTLWLEAQGALSRIRTAGGTVRVEGSECLVQWMPSAPQTTVLFREAWAEETIPGSLRVACLEGKLRVEAGAEAWTLEAGHLLERRQGQPPSLRPLGAGEDLLAWLEPLRAKRVYAGAQALEGKARLALPDPGPGDYTLEIVVKPRKPAGDLGIAFPAEEMFPYWMVPVKNLGEGVSRLRVRRHGGQIFFSQGTRSAMASQVGRDLTPGAQAPGLQVWGASVEVLEVTVVTWRAAP